MLREVKQVILDNSPVVLREKRGESDLDLTDDQMNY